jgi:tetratricopeptide (TPR) repeat protein
MRSESDWRALAAKAERRLASGQAGEACGLLRGADVDPTAPPAVLRLLATSLRRLNRGPEAAPVLERLTVLQPDSAVAEHNLAALLGDLGRFGESEGAARRALGKGGRAPETWLVLARALQGQIRLNEAEAAFRQALGVNPAFADAHRDLAQLIWMRDGDAGAALAGLDAALSAEPGNPALAALRATVQREVLGDREAYEGLAGWADAADAGVQMAAAAAAGGFDPVLALRHAERAERLAPGHGPIRLVRLSALIAAGRSDEALPGLDAWLVDAPHDQYALALQRTAWRITGDPRALKRADYEALVRAYDLEPPTGAPDREGWLAAVATGLRRMHPFRTHPFGQSVRFGAQSALDPRRAGDPEVDGLFEALRGPITRHVAHLARSDDPAGRRAGGGWDIAGAWSVRLTAGGRHSDHVHPEGWISSAAYIVLPEAAEDAPRGGWLRFGAARIGAFILEPEYWVEPRPGAVVLFPSYLWHGTEPFLTPGERLTVAFDVQPV